MSVKNAKIDEIIEDIISQNRIEFNKKSKLQQDKEKDTISEVIEKSLVGLNNYERTMVLIELSKSVHNSQKSFFDSMGNVNINGIIEVTNTTIRKAEKEGIIITNQRSERNNNLKEAILTVAIVDKLIDNYDKLSFEEKEDIWNNYKNLSNEEKKRLVDAHITEIENLAKKCEDVGDSKTKEGLNNIANSYKEVEDLYDNANSEEGKQIFINYVMMDKTFWKQYEQEHSDFNINDLHDEYIQYIRSKDRVNIEVIKKLMELRKAKTPKEKEEIRKDIVNVINKDENFVEQYKREHPDFNGEYSDDLIETYNKYYKEIRSEVRDNQKKYKEIIKDKKFIEQYKREHPDFNGEYSEDLRNSYNEYKPRSVDEVHDEIFSESENMNDEISAMFLPNDSRESKNLTENLQLINEEINQIPIALKNSGFAEEEIKEGLTQYKECLESFDEETLEEFKTLTSEEIIAGIKEGFEDMVQEGEVSSNIGKILGLMAGITYHGNIKEVLIDSEKREQFFSELEEITTMDFESRGAEATQEGTEQQFTDEELKQVFNEYFKANSVEMDVSAIERQAEKAEMAEPFGQSVEGNEISGLNQDGVANIFDGDMESVSDEDNATQGSTSNGAKKFSVNDVKAAASGVKMPEIQDSTKLIHEVLNEKSEREEEQEVQTV